MSSSYDSSVESLPVFEPLSDDVDVYQNQIFDGEIFISNYQNITVVNNIESCSIKRTTNDIFDSDSILSLAVSNNNFESIMSRVEALKVRNAIIDFSSSIQFSRTWSNKTPIYLVELEISSSSQKTKLLSSGSSFYICDDNNELINRSSEINESNTIYEIVKIL
ncbi:MAG: hypothetical protein WC554_19035 [Clostridia bacterium]